MLNTPSLECRKLRYSQESSDDIDKSNISVLQYNILADAAIPRGDEGKNINGAYLFCPEEHRYMDERHGKIMSEVFSLQPDIVSFQEVEVEHFKKSLGPDMNDLGYDSVEHLRHADHIGLAIFYKKEKFNLQSNTSFILHERVKYFLQRIGVKEEICEDLRDYMKEMSTYIGIIDPPGCLMANLQHKESSKTLCVATVHVTWKEYKYPVLQMLQGACVMEEFAKFAAGAPCIFAGDFNVTPDMPLYQMLTSSSVCELTVTSLQSDSDFGDTQISFQGQNIINILKDFRFILNIKSAYYNVMEKEPAFTSLDEYSKNEDQVGLFKACVDYIWYTDELCPTTVLDVPEEHHITEHVGLPSVVFPSDHLPLYAVFEFKK